MTDEPRPMPEEDWMRLRKGAQLWEVHRERDLCRLEAGRLEQQLAEAVAENAKLRQIVGLYVAVHGSDRVPEGLRELAASCAAHAAARGGR